MAQACAEERFWNQNCWDFERTVYILKGTNRWKHCWNCLNPEWNFPWEKRKWVYSWMLQKAEDHELFMLLEGENLEYSMAWLGKVIGTKHFDIFRVECNRETSKWCERELEVFWLRGRYILEQCITSYQGLGCWRHCRRDLGCASLYLVCCWMGFFYCQGKTNSAEASDVDIGFPAESFLTAVYEM